VSWWFEQEVTEIAELDRAVDQTAEYAEYAEVGKGFVRSVREIKSKITSMIKKGGQLIGRARNDVPWVVFARSNPAGTPPLRLWRSVRHPA
jgi:hypothetical protein